MTMPATAPPLIPDFPSEDDEPLSFLAGLFRRFEGGAVNGGGGGAGPEVQELPSVLHISAILV